mgnify:CR=1 FL=1|tara:strand:+ start:483 stop:743 length:261 start_codon:yes stop_codon:yes gene_type:complete
MNTDKIAHKLKIKLHNELCKDDSWTIENINDYNIQVVALGDDMYKVRMNLVFVTMALIREDSKDLHNVSRLLIKQIRDCNLYCHWV